MYAGIVCVVYMYSDLISKVHDEDNISLVEKLEMKKVFEIWWFYARFGAITLLCLATASVFFGIFAINMLFLIKYPDYFVATYGLASSTKSPIFMMYSRYNTIFFTVGLIIAVSCGLGTARSHIEMYRVQAATMDRAYHVYGPNAELKAELENQRIKLGNLNEDVIKHLESVHNITDKGVLRSLRTASVTQTPDQGTADQGWW